MDIQELKKVSSTLALSGQFVMIPACDVLKLLSVVEAAQGLRRLEGLSPGQGWYEHTEQLLVSLQALEEDI